MFPIFESSATALCGTIGIFYFCFFCDVFCEDRLLVAGFPVFFDPVPVPWYKLCSLGLPCLLFIPKKTKTGVLSEEWESPIGPWNPKGNSMKWWNLHIVFRCFFSHIQILQFQSFQLESNCRTLRRFSRQLRWRWVNSFQVAKTHVCILCKWFF